MKPRAGCIGLAILAGGLTAVLVRLFLVPVPSLEGTRSPQAQGDADSQFIEINGLDVHVMGSGEPVFMLLHSFSASLYSWWAVMGPLGEHGTVIAFHHPVLGLTERLLNWEGGNPYSPDAQVVLTLGLLDHFGVQQAILVGNSAGGTVVMQTSLAHPEPVSALILVDPAVYTISGVSEWARPLLATPQMRYLGPLLARQIRACEPEMLKLAWHNPALLQPEVIELYQKSLQADNWDKELREFTLASHPSSITELLNEFTLPVLVITSDDDRIVPTVDSILLANELPNADLLVIPNAEHVTHEEQLEAFMQAVTSF